MSEVNTLPASAFRPGDIVMGTDEGGTYIGEVSRHHPTPRHPEEVLVYWSSEAYSVSSLGHACPPELLRLWPAAAHADRIRSVQAGSDKPLVGDYRNQGGCHADRDGECSWAECPQIREGEPAKSGRHCPLDASGGES